ncbi:MAG: DEAD/DEAH box helicase family protein [Betaproteobacteria bacterium]|nr:DEAD/DEAH box helicase family protein [Betaproteobacteria bacterium]
MSTQPKQYQKDAVANVLGIFRYASSQLEEAQDEQSQRNVVAHNGCVLIQAPTGAGKTLMAGLVAEQFSREAKVVWFWFTPFAGLVEQARIAMKKHFQGLRIRDIRADRLSMGSKSGDVFVSTWAAVAASNKESRKLRNDGDLSLALDTLVPSLRDAGFHIGVVVDEAHHTFSYGTEAVRFFTTVLRPEFTLLITATPDDSDAERFKQAIGVAELHRITVSRMDAVDAGLIKEGIKSVAYLAPDDQKALVDFQLAALSDARDVHTQIKKQLKTEGIDLTPLMLVQVASSENSVAEARKRLLQLGFRDDAIASYTANEPSDDLLAVAFDESKEVLIFKLAVALGFDAPRAFTLVSMRGAKDTDFGIQVVGRILRVHAQLQGKKTLPELLRYGYVFLADSENQSGLTSAADKINAIKTELSAISPYTMVVRLAGQPQIQVVTEGQSTMFPIASDLYRAPNLPTGETLGASGQAAHSPSSQGTLASLLFPPASGESLSSNNSATKIKALMPGSTSFQLKAGIPRIFKRELLPLATNELLKCIGANVAISDREFTAGLREGTKVTRREEEIFTRTVGDRVIQVRLSQAELARRAQKVLFEPDYLDVRDLHATLIERLRSEYGRRDIECDDSRLDRALDLILVSYPNLIRMAARKCAAQFKEIIDTAPLPENIELPPGARTSRLNIYGVMPPDLNRDEAAFAELLDSDTTGVVEWWHRNEPRKPWSVGMVLPNGAQYFPDFLVKVKERNRGEGCLLVEIKGDHILNKSDDLDKSVSEHKLYKRPMMLVREESGRFMTVEFREAQGKNELDRLFQLDLMKHF